MRSTHEASGYCRALSNPLASACASVLMEFHSQPIALLGNPRVDPDWLRMKHLCCLKVDWIAYLDDSCKQRWISMGVGFKSSFVEHTLSLFRSCQWGFSIPFPYCELSIPDSIIDDVICLWTFALDDVESGWILSILAQHHQPLERSLSSFFLSASQRLNGDSIFNLKYSTSRWFHKALHCALYEWGTCTWPTTSLGVGILRAVNGTELVRDPYTKVDKEFEKIILLKSRLYRETKQEADKNGEVFFNLQSFDFNFPHLHLRIFSSYESRSFYQREG